MTFIYYPTLLVVAVYQLYYVGIAGVLSNDKVLKTGDGAPVQVISLILIFTGLF